MLHARKLALSLVFFAASALAAPKLTAPQLIDLAAKDPARLPEAIRATFPDKDLKAGTAWAGHGADFFFAIDAATKPALLVDDKPGTEMRSLAGTTLWYGVARIPEVGAVHAFRYQVNGANFGGVNELPVFGPEAYLAPGVPTGKLSEKLIYTSKIYDGMKSDYWIYVPAQYDPKSAAALMVFQDGGGHLDRDGRMPTLNVIDNLIAAGRMPVTICIFINPGDIQGAPGTPTYQFVEAYGKKWKRELKDSMRSTLYDTVSDRYPRFLRDEVLAEVGAKYNLRSDAYSRAIMGASSGGICAFNAAWQMTSEFSRVLSWIGSFVSIQWKEDPAVADGGQDYPEKVAREAKRNLRVWLQDGNQDMENSWYAQRYGSWPLANVRMANALKIAGYDFHFSFGRGGHNGIQGAVELPAALEWLWRDYDAAKSAQIYEQEPAEKAKPLFRVSILNR